jgi:hypothetical protein
MRQCDAVLNLTYYFETLLSRDVNSPRLCFVNKVGQCVAVLNLTYFETLSSDVNNPRLCFVNSEEECDAVLNLTLTCGKQSAILN